MHFDFYRISGGDIKDEPISVGDLVMVIKPAPCCGYDGDVGRPFIVQDIEKSDGYCIQCGASETSVDALEVDDAWHDIRTLKRITPLSELESVDQPEEVTA